MRRMVFAHRLLPVSLRHTRFGATQDPSGLAHSLQNSGARSIAKPSYWRFQEHLSLQEISVIVGAPVSTVASRIIEEHGNARPQFEGDTA